MPLLHWTGHPLVDVGIATLCALVDKRDPSDLTLDDLDAAGNEIRQAYELPEMNGYITCVYMNAPYVQPKMRTTSPAEYKSKVKRLTLPHRVPADPEADGLKCAFSGEPAHLMLHRVELPLMTSEGVMNFFPAGRDGLPVAAPYALAIHALAIGGRRSEGKLLIANSDSPILRLRFAKKFLDDNRRILSLIRSNQLSEGPPALEEHLPREWSGGWDKEKKRPKYPDAKGPQSLVVDDLIEILGESSMGPLRDTPLSVTAYLLSNSGQGPSLAIEPIPGELVSFLQELHGAEFASKWRRLVARSWRRAKSEAAAAVGADEAATAKPSRSRKKTETNGVRPGAGRSPNDLYADLLAIFASGYRDWQAATRFVRRHLLSDSTRYYFDPRLPPRLDVAQLELIDWQLTSHFLTKALGMKKERLDQIRLFADNLAELIAEHNDRPLFRNLVFTGNEWVYRGILTKVQQRYAREKSKLLFGLEEYIDIFISDDPGDRVPWSLVRDLISIRLVETLFKKGFFATAENRAALESPDETTADSAA